jgi:hypothetical protein
MMNWEGSDLIHSHYNGFYSAKDNAFVLTHITINYYEDDEYRQRREPLNKNTYLCFRYHNKQYDKYSVI